MHNEESFRNKCIFLFQPKVSLPHRVFLCLFLVVVVPGAHYRILFRQLKLFP